MQDCFYADRLDATTERDSSRVTARVAGALAKSPYLMGERFTAIDLFTSGPFEWDPGLVDENPAITAWLGRLATRPAALQAAALDRPKIA
jgi:glutathione S-transferase